MYKNEHSFNVEEASKLQCADVYGTRAKSETHREDKVVPLVAAGQYAVEMVVEGCKGRKENKT